MTARQYILTVLLLLAASVGSWVFLNVLQERSIPIADKTRPDSYMENVSGARFDEQGNLKDELIAPHLLHFSEGDTTDVTSPHLIIYNADSTGQPWHVTSNYGKALDGVNSIELWDNVKLRQPESADNAEIIMTTTQITIYPKTQFAHTDQPVKVIQLGSVVNSVGLDADIKTGTIKLLKEAHGKYQQEVQAQ